MIIIFSYSLNSFKKLFFIIFFILFISYILKISNKILMKKSYPKFNYFNKLLSIYSSKFSIFFKFYIIFIFINTFYIIFFAKTVFDIKKKINSVLNNLIIYY